MIGGWGGGGGGLAIIRKTLNLFQQIHLLKPQFVHFIGIFTSTFSSTWKPNQLDQMNEWVFRKSHHATFGLCNVHQVGLRVGGRAGILYGPGDYTLIESLQTESVSVRTGTHPHYPPQRNRSTACIKTENKINYLMLVMVNNIAIS